MLRSEVFATQPKCVLLISYGMKIRFMRMQYQERRVETEEIKLLGGGLLIMCMRFPPASIYLQSTQAWCFRRSDEDIESPGSGVQMVLSYCVDDGIQIQVLCKMQHVLLTPESSLQDQVKVF